ncbi:MAG: Uma2 family endonuclease [Pirellulaceae bacterium]|nr:Uma2 family endonuclease [Planctomycetales bacterium]
MATIIRDPILEQRIIADRVERGIDRYDEVWEGVYVMPPMLNDEHQMLVGRLTRILDEIIGDRKLGDVRPGVNISDRLDGWQQNYRVPDVAVFLNITKAVNHDSFWLGGPDFAIEIASPGDQVHDKIPFYSKVATRELLIIDRSPWQLELYRLQSRGKLALVGISTTDDKAGLFSELLAIQIRLLPEATGAKRRQIQIDETISPTSKSPRRSWII